jgi:hypothetical protein
MSRAQNIFEILGVSLWETSVSRMIAAALNSHAESRADFIRVIAPAVTPPDPADPWMARTEASVAGGRIDLVIAWQHADHRQVLIVEHKLHATESGRQTALYVGAWAEVLPSIEQALTLASGEWSAPAFVYLTLFADVPVDRTFRQVTHAALSDWFRSFTGTDPASFLCAQWSDLLAEFTAAQSVEGNVSFVHAMELAAHSPLDAGFVLFEHFARAIGQAANLPSVDVYRSKARGRSWYGAHLARASWTILPHDAPAQMAAWIHFQLRWDRIGHEKGTVDLGLFYELRDYDTQKNFQRDVSEDSYRAYMERRGRFAQEPTLRALLTDKGWKLGGRWNQVATKRIKAANHSWDDLTDACAVEFRALIDPIETSVARLFGSNQCAMT